MGDHMAGLAAAGAVSAALYARERTGQGQLVSVSLLRIGMYMLGWDINMALRLGFPTTAITVAAPPNPLITAYETGDGKRFWMLGLQADRHWPDVLRAVERPEWAEDERFSSIMARFQHAAELVSELNAIFANRPLAEWAPILDREDVWWAPVQHAHETVDDPLARAAGGFVPVPVEGGDPVEMVASPVTSAAPPGRRARCRPSSPSTPRKSCSSWATTGTGSSSSRSSAPSPDMRIVPGRRRDGA
jgi:crotonobetainyl-CoA:carnitine CoA-transferase CaiB-like acyl-CoA transferase